MVTFCDGVVGQKRSATPGLHASGDAEHLLLPVALFFFFFLFKLPVFGFQVVTVMRYMSGPAGLSPGLPCLFQKFNPALK